MYINFICTNIVYMLQITKNNRKIISVEIEWKTINILKDQTNILMTKRELSKVFVTSKEQVKLELENIWYREIKISWKTKKYYSIENIIVLGYKLKTYKQTRTLVLLQRYIKTHSTNESFLGRMKKIYADIENISIV